MTSRYLTILAVLLLSNPLLSWAAPDDVTMRQAKSVCQEGTITNRSDGVYSYRYCYCCGEGRQTSRRFTGEGVICHINEQDLNRFQEKQGKSYNKKDPADRFAMDSMMVDRGVRCRDLYHGEKQSVVEWQRESLVDRNIAQEAAKNDDNNPECPVEECHFVENERFLICGQRVYEKFEESFSMSAEDILNSSCQNTCRQLVKKLPSALSTQKHFVVNKQFACTSLMSGNMQPVPKYFERSILETSVLKRHQDQINAQDSSRKPSSLDLSQ